MACTTPMPSMDVLYGLKVLRANDNPWSKYDNPDHWMWPRSNEERIERMDRYIDYKRRKRRHRVLIHLGIGLVVLLGTPVVIALAAAFWKTAIAQVLS